MEIHKLHAAKTHFSRLVDQAAAGEEIIIAKGNRPMAKLVPLGAPPTIAKRTLGALAGRAVVPSDFDSPLPDAVIDAFEGR